MYSLNSNQKLQFTHRQKIYYTLRIASAMCFIGHGAFGILTKSIWSNYFAVFGIGHALSYKLMPVVGSIDILCGIIILSYPLRAAITWLVIWGLITALLRPLSGEPFPEFIERAGNFGAPLALLLLSGDIHFNFKRLMDRLQPSKQVAPKAIAWGVMVLRIVVCLLFLGHGWLNLIEKKSLLDQYMQLGFINPGKTAQFIGLFEIIAALAVLIRPIRSFVLILFVWKITSELFYPNHELFEWIERGGSYGAILALWFALEQTSVVRRNTEIPKQRVRLLNYIQAKVSFYLPILFLISLIFSCNAGTGNKIEPKHVESLAIDFMKTDIVPKMKDPKPYEIVGAKMVTKTAADNINDYRFTYEHLSFNHDDSVLNKRRLDSIIEVSKHPDSIVSVSVNVEYKTKYKRGDIATDSIKLGYNPEKDKITFWPF